MSHSAPSLARIGTIPAGAFKLPYLIEGTGQPAIVIGSVQYYQRAFSQNLRNHLQLVFIDHRGFAPSPGPVDTSEFELDKLVEDVERLRQRLGLRQVAVIGHSGHGYIALEYAKKYPECTSHVVMIGIAPNLSQASAELAYQNYQRLADADRLAAERENLRRMSDEPLAALSPDQAFVRRYIRNAARVWYDPRFDCTSLWEDVTINMDMFGYVWGKLFAEIDVTHGLEQFDRPVFLALGRYDFIVAPPASWDDVKSKFKNLTIRIFERSGHTPQFEEPELFDPELLSWMHQHAV
ncbi:MAG TPA: alpha/beta hydrolase [Terriglobia bacterium]|nr:alpha/beta hydrolase [Terriglobia bacterium]